MASNITAEQAMDPDGWARRNQAPREFLAIAAQEPNLKLKVWDQARLYQAIVKKNRNDWKAASRVVCEKAIDKETYGILGQARVIDFKPVQKGKKQPFTWEKLSRMFDPIEGFTFEDLKAKIEKIYLSMGNRDLRTFDTDHLKNTVEAYFFFNKECKRWFPRFLTNKQIEEDPDAQGWNDWVDEWDRWFYELMNEEEEFAHYEDWREERETMEVDEKVYRREPKRRLALEF